MRSRAVLFAILLVPATAAVQGDQVATGLAHQTAAQISGSAGVYQRTQVAPAALPDEGGSAQQLPNFVGFTFSPATGYTAGAALLATNSWNQETDSQLFSAVAVG